MIGVIVVLMMEDADLGLKRPATIIFKIAEKVLMLRGDVEIGLRPPPIPTIIHMAMVDCWVYLLIIVLFKKVFIAII